MSNSDKDDNLVSITKSTPRLTPPGYKLQLSLKQAAMISEFIDSPVYKILKTAYVAQRKDHIARRALNSANTLEMQHYYKGMAAEITVFFQNLEEVKATLKKLEDKEDAKN